MANLLSTIKDYQNIIEKFGSFFEQDCSPSFTNLVWQIIVNDSYNDKAVAFTPTFVKNRLEIVIAEMNEYGYYRTAVGFKEGIDYDQAYDICLELNAQFFGYTERLSEAIMISSMREDLKPSSLY